MLSLSMLAVVIACPLVICVSSIYDEVSYSDDVTMRPSARGMYIKVLRVILDSDILGTACLTQGKFGSVHLYNRSLYYGYFIHI
jgi:hypothetical protein